MINYFKSNNFNYTKENDLQSRDFTLLSESWETDEDYSTFAKMAFVKNQSFLMFLSNDDYSADRIKKLIKNIRDLPDIVNLKSSAERLENGYELLWEFETRVFIDDPIKAEYILDNYIEGA